MPGARRTTDHDAIRQWAEERGGRPVRARDGEEARLRIEFPDEDVSAPLEPIDWDEFFAELDAAGLEFLYQELYDDGAPSRFHRVVSPGEE
jgi:hypothetical protein